MIFLIILSVVLLFLGFAAFKSDVRSKTNIFFLLFIFGLVLWVFSNYFSNNLEAYELVLVANRFIFFSTTLLVFALFLFASVFPNSILVLKQRYYLLTGLLSIFVGIISFTPLIVQGVTLEEGYSSIEFGPLIVLYVLNFILLFGLFVYLLIKKYRKAIGLEKIQLQYLLLGAIFTAMGAMITNLILPIVFKIFFLSAFGPTFLIIFVGFSFTSIVKHRFLGIRFLLGKILFFIVLSIFWLSGFFLFGWLATIVFGGIFKTNTILASLVIAPIYAWIYLRFNNYIYRVIEDRIVYIDRHPTDMLSKFLKSTSTELDVDKISVYVVNTVKKYLDLEKVGVVLFDKENSKVLYKKLVGFKLDNVRDLLQVIHYWKDIGKDPVLVLEEAKKLEDKDPKDVKNRLDKIIKCMEDEEISAILPLNRKVQLNGIIVVGNKKNSDPFSVEDMRFLEDIIANASVAMGRAILYKEVQGFNETLKTKVEEQTKDLKEKVVQLNEARRKEHDMIDIMGHELRTPMTIIRNYHELLDNQMSKSNKGSTSEKYGKYMEILGENIQREITLINVLLSATKLEDGQLEINREPVDIIDVIEDGIMGHEKDAKEKGLYIKFNKPRDWEKYPQVFADRVRIQEIADNLISNAVKYTNKGGVEIRVSYDNKYAKVDIQDTGDGIQKKDLKKIGQKFYRSNQYTEKRDNRGTPLVRPGGSGLGLFVTFGLIKMHGGRIAIDSKLGKGSTFSFTIPLVKGEKAQKAEKVSKYSGDMFERLGLKRKVK